MPVRTEEQLIPLLHTGGYVSNAHIDVCSSPGQLVGSDNVEEPRWWLITTRPRYERKLAESMMRLGLAYFLPMEQCSVRSGGQHSLSQRVLFSCYLFYFGLRSRWHELRSRTSVYGYTAAPSKSTLSLATIGLFGGVVTIQDRYQLDQASLKPIDNQSRLQKELGWLHLILRANENTSLLTGPLIPGQSVLIKEGTYAGLLGRISTDPSQSTCTVHSHWRKDRQLVWVDLTLLGRSVGAEVDREYIEVVDNAPHSR